MSLFKNLFFGGSAGYQNLSAAEFSQTAANDKNAVILDVRTPAEFKSGHLPKALNIDINSADFQHKAMKLDKQKTYYVYCRSGGRSSMACGALSSIGITKLYNMQGGIMSYGGKLV